MTDINQTRDLLINRFDKLLLEKSDMQDLFGVSKSSIDNYIKNNDADYFPPHIKLGGKVGSKATIRWSVEEVARFISRHHNGDTDDNRTNLK